MFYPTCGMGDIFSMTVGGGLAPPPPPPPPAVVQVETPNVVDTGGGMPGGDIVSQYMPPGPMKLSFSPAFVACTKAKGIWSAKTHRCLPRIDLRRARLTGTQSAQLPIPPSARQGATTRILTLGGGASGLAQGVPEIGFEQRDGLWIVSAAALPVLEGVLGMMAYASDPSGNAGQANFMMPAAGARVALGTSAVYRNEDASMTASAVVGAKLAAGQAALLAKASVPTGVLKLVFTSDPAVVAQLAGPSGTHALITDKPDDVVAAALALLHGGSVPTTSVASTTPWLAIGVVGAGLLIAGAIFMTRTPARATANAAKPPKKRKLSKEQWAALRAIPKEQWAAIEERVLEQRVMRAHRTKARADGELADAAARRARRAAREDSR